VDMQEVNQFLDEKRFEERVGGSFEERRDEELFSIETKANEAETIKNRKQIKSLRCFANLQGLPGAKDPVPLRNRTLTPEERENPIVKAMKEQKIKNGKIQKKFKDKKADREATLRVKEAVKEEAKTRRRTKFDFDLWDVDQGGDKAPLVDDWVKKEGLIHNAIGQNKYLPKYSKKRNFSTGTTLPSVEVPDPGASYNPNVEDHQDLLWKATIVEIQKEKALQKIERATTEMFPGKKDAPSENSYMLEMTEGIVELGGGKEEKENSDDASSDDASDADEKIEEDSEVMANSSTIKPKSRKQKRDKRIRMFEEQKLNREKEIKLNESEIHRLKSLKKELKEEEEKVVKNKERRAEKLQEKMSGPLPLSNYKFEPQEIELKLSDELTGNLRNLKPEGSLLEDRFKSMQKRNLIEVRVKQKTVKRLKRKTYEKRSHKMGWEENKNKIAKRARAEKKNRKKKM